MNTVTIDSNVWTIARVTFGKDYFPNSASALQAFLQDYRQSKPNVVFDVNNDGTLTADDILTYLGYIRTGVNINIDGNLPVAGEFSNSRQVGLSDTFLTEPWGELYTPGFGFQWASWQDEESAGNWNTLKTSRLHIPVVNSPIAGTMDLWLIR